LSRFRCSSRPSPPAASCRLSQVSSAGYFSREPAGEVTNPSSQKFAFRRKCAIFPRNSRRISRWSIWLTFLP
jgi:hypothetical protein